MSRRRRMRRSIRPTRSVDATSWMRGGGTSKPNRAVYDLDVGGRCQAHRSSPWFPRSQCVLHRPGGRIDRMGWDRIHTRGIPLLPPPSLPWIFAASVRIGRAPSVHARAAHRHDRSIDSFPLDPFPLDPLSNSTQPHRPDAPTVDRPHRSSEKKLPENPTVGRAGVPASFSCLVWFSF